MRAIVEVPRRRLPFVNGSGFLAVCLTHEAVFSLVSTYDAISFYSLCLPAGI